jgi:hypothetical protein
MHGRGGRGPVSRIGRAEGPEDPSVVVPAPRFFARAVSFAIVHAMRSWFSRSALVLAALAVPLTLTACSNPPTARTAKVAAGEMPSGESWSGVYFHPVYGYLHLVEEGSNIQGRWRRADQSHWGELSGTRDGNVFRYKWTEHKVGLVGSAADSRGKGYFVYKSGKDGAELDGEFGLNDDEAGSDWHSVKQQRMSPDLRSINGDAAGIAAPGATKGWE